MFQDLATRRRSVCGAWQRDYCLSLGAPCWVLETNSDVVSYASASAAMTVRTVAL
jgi:hypothetical protein